MRRGLLVPGIAIGIVLCIGLVRACDRATSAALTEDARVAIEVRCRGQEGRAARACRDMLTKLYLAGSLDPDKTLRTYCEEIKNGRWGGSRPAPPQLCVERFGGWPEG